MGMGKTMHLDMQIQKGAPHAYSTGNRGFVKYTADHSQWVVMALLGGLPIYP
jgi:hypothetical protein